MVHMYLKAAHLRRSLFYFLHCYTRRSGFCPVSCKAPPIFIHSCDIPCTVFVCPMTQRDVNIIAMVYEYEGCAVEHIRQVFFQGSKNRSIPCYRRLSYLIKEGYLRSLLLPALNKKRF